MIRISILLMYSLKFLDKVESFPLLSLVIGWLLPKSDAKMLMLSNLETNLSFLAKVEWALRFLLCEDKEWEDTCSMISGAIFLTFGIVQDVTWPDLGILVLFIIFLVDCPSCLVTKLPLLIDLGLESFLNVDGRSSFLNVEGS